MEKEDFSQLRHYLGKTQVQIARLFGVSSQAVHSFEQGWRPIPTYIERQMLFLMYLKKRSQKSLLPCWEIQNCPLEWRNNCAAWEFNAGQICWFINGTFCKGKHLNNWETKMMVCRQCEVLRKLFPLTLQRIN